MAKFEKLCTECKKQFSSYQSQKRKFCSYACKVVYQTGKLMPRKQSRLTKDCLICGNNFFVAPASTQVYCSVTCCRADPDWITRMANSRRGQGHTEETKKQISETLKNRFLDEEYKAQWLELNFHRLNLKPNGLEQKFIRLLELVAPGEFVYTGAGELIVGTKIPDFRHKELPLLVELYGEYWHRGENPKDRIDYFAKYGYTTIILWEREVEEIIKKNCSKACILAAIAGMAA